MLRLVKYTRALFKELYAVCIISDGNVFFTWIITFVITEM